MTVATKDAHAGMVFVFRGGQARFLVRLINEVDSLTWLVEWLGTEQNFFTDLRHLHYAEETDGR